MPRKFKGDVLIENSLVINNELSLVLEAIERALILDADGKVRSSLVTSIELGYLSGVTSPIQTQLDAKLDDFSSVNDNRLVRTDGTSGDAVQESGVVLDDSNNITGVNDLTVDGNLTVNGTTTTINTTTLDVEDANITVNNGGDQSTANTNVAGFTVELSDATDVRLGYDSTLTSKFKVGEVGSEVEIADVSSSQVIENKTIDGTSATGNNTVSIDADNAVYNNTTSGLTATNAQAAIDELENEIDTKQDDVITTEGDLVIGDNTGEESRLAIGTDGQILTSDGTTASWETLIIPDEQVGISANDTTPGFLEDKIVTSEGINPTGIIEVTTINDGGDEDLQIQIDESKIDHDSLENFVANEHIDHSSVEITTVADSGLTGGGDITSTRSLSVDIDGTTEETVTDNADTILIYDNSGSLLRKMSRANFLNGIAESSEGDIFETSFSGANNQTVDANVTGLMFDNTVVRSFKAHISVVVDADTDLYEEYDIQGIQRGSDWNISQQTVGDETNVDFSITNDGQIQYTSDNYAGFVSLTIKYRAITTTL